jgi:hypothetical protein
VKLHKTEKVRPWSLVPEHSPPPCRSQIFVLFWPFGNGSGFGVAFSFFFFLFSILIRYLGTKPFVAFLAPRSLGVHFLLDLHCSASHCLALINPDFQFQTLVAKVYVPPYRHRRGLFDPRRYYDRWVVGTAFSYLACVPSGVPQGLPFCHFAFVSL